MNSPVQTSPNGVVVPAQVNLGSHTYRVVPQRHAYLTRKLGTAVAELQDLGDVDTSSMEGIVASFGDRAYDFLKVLIPDLMPRYEFAGFPTHEAMEKGDYNEEYDHSPTLPEIVTAFQVCLAVNRLDLAKNLGKLLPVDLLKAYMGKAMISFMESQNSRSIEVGSATSTTSGTTPPTSE